MGCSGRVKVQDLRPEQKWDFISLNDFKTTSCFAYLAYGYLWISLLISVAVYAVDTFTAVNLLAFDKWSGEIEPKVPFKISKWIFASCIIASWLNVGYEHMRAMRVMKRGAVAESFMDSLAVRLQCIRLGKGRGYRRFLVFAELTKSKKGAEYVALFTYFSFQAWIRIIFCQGPRQVINALTLYSVYTAKLDPNNASDVGSFLSTFFKNIELLANDSNQQAVVLSGMVFTLVIWIFGALSLLLAMFFWLFFLWHYIPNADGTLGRYCERKVEKRLSRIVSVKVNKAIAKEEERRIRADAKALKKGEKPAVGRQATLPVLFDSKSDDKLPQMPMLSRNDTMTTLPLYSSRPGTPSGQPPMPALELDQLDQKRPFPNRTVTDSST
ncbi:putative vacuolar membrane protein, partial [Lachnellula suecica]